MKWVITVEKNKGFKRRRMFQNAAYEVLEAVGYQMVESGLVVCLGLFGINGEESY